MSHIKNSEDTNYRKRKPENNTFCEHAYSQKTNAVLYSPQDFIKNIDNFMAGIRQLINDHEKLKTRVLSLEEFISGADNQKTLYNEGELVSITQSVREYGISKPTIYKYIKLGVLRLVIKSPMMFTRHNMESLVRSLKP